MNNRVACKSVMTILVLGALALAGCAKGSSDQAGQNTRPVEFEPQWVIRQPTRPNIALIYVHGITGDATGTWTAANGKHFWDLLNETPQESGKTDAFVYGFPSFVFTNGSLDTREAANNLYERLKFGGVLTYPTIVFVAHSMGGLVVLRELIAHPELTDRVPLIMLYATPMEGSTLAAVAKDFSPNHGYGDMTPANGNALLQLLDDDWKRIPAAVRPQIRCAYEKKPIAGITVVPWSSATRLCDGISSPIEATHTSIVKPERPDADAIAYLVNALQDYMQKTHPTSGQAVVVPPPPAVPPSPVQGLWSVTLSCQDTSAVNELNARFEQGLYSRGFKSPTVTGRTELSMGFEGSNRVHLLGFIVFGDSDVYPVDAIGEGDGQSYSGLGTFGNSNKCQLLAKRMSSD